jgi:cell shape-determining protein MreC
MNASPPHIVDSGSSVKTLGDYIEQESRETKLLQQLELAAEEIRKLQEENKRLKREIDNLMDGRC